jgi:hypothetical protein
MIVAGNGIYDKCSYCQKLVKLNKFLFGSLHICLTDSERNFIDSKFKWECDAMIEQQRFLGSFDPIEMLKNRSQAKENDQCKNEV